MLDLQFHAYQPNRNCVADFAYVWTAEGWPYVAVVLDLCSRRAVGWSMQASMTSQLVADALMMAVWRGASRGVAAGREPRSADVFDYIDRFYNPTRRQSSLGYDRLIEFEKTLDA